MFNFRGPVQDLGEKLSKSGASLTTSYTGGDTIAAAGTNTLEADCAAAFDAGTSLTDIRFRCEVSDDDVTWEPVAGVRASDGATVAELVFLAGGGNARDRLITSSDQGSATMRLVP